MGARGDKARSAMQSTSGAKVTTPSERDIVITRTFDAPRTVVFEAWTKAEHVTEWWDPRGTPLSVCEIDLRPNGAFRWVTRAPDGSEHSFAGTYRDISAPERLVFTTRMLPSGAESVGTLVFSEHGGKTMLTLTIECSSRADRDALLEMRVDAGTVRTLDNLAEHLQKICASSCLVNKVVSKDGTSIAFDRIGHGSPVILVDGALCWRGLGPSGQLAKLLAPHFTVFTYDRRGRGASGDTLPYAVEREVEDIEALVSEAGGAAFLWGVSSGAVLALEAANRLEGIRKLAVFEAPFIVDASRPTTVEDWVRIREAVSAGRPSDAINTFLKSVGMPAFLITLMRLTPVWSRLRAVAHTLPHDGDIVQNLQRGRPLRAGSWASVTIPTLVMDGGKSPAWIREANRSLASALPNAQYRTLEGQTHAVKARAHAPALVEFFEG
jgi:uncharacterized protein YndB with AHSA1/START domain/pimeloyl-ACP methyl ester carboxylesterase